MFKTKAAMAVLVAVFVFGAGVSTAAAASGAFGQQVKEQVQDCKQGMATNDVHGIGDCVSDFTQQHGKQQRHSPQSKPATSTSPQQLKEQVQDCKQGAATNGVHGIGDCVSDVAQRHGKQQHGKQH
jgi:hypothetical protein